MQMRTAGVAACAAERDHRAALNGSAGLHAQLRQMRIEAAGMTVVTKDDNLAVATHGAGKLNGSVGHGLDGCTGGHGEVDARWISGQPVCSLSPQAEVGAASTGQRGMEQAETASSRYAPVSIRLMTSSRPAGRRVPGSLRDRWQGCNF